MNTWSPPFPFLPSLTGKNSGLRAGRQVSPGFFSCHPWLSDLAEACHILSLMSKREGDGTVPSALAASGFRRVFCCGQPWAFMSFIGTPGSPGSSRPVHPLHPCPGVLRGRPCQLFPLQTELSGVTLFPAFLHGCASASPVCLGASPSPTVSVSPVFLLGVAPARP